MSEGKPHEGQTSPGAGGGNTKSHAGGPKPHTGSPQAKETKPAPRIPFFSDDVLKLPVIGEVKGYYLLLVALFIFYIISKNVLVGLLAGALIVFIVLWEFYAGAKTGGWKSEVKETAVALGFAVLLWFGSGWLLNTPTPINAIVSCSMLPAYERGDMVILQGAAPNAPKIQLAGGIESIAQKATVNYRGENLVFDGSLYAYCSGSGNGKQICADFVNAPENFSETHGALKINYGKCTRTYPGKSATTQGPCARGVEVGGGKISPDMKNGVIVYAPKDGDIYSKVGDIVHRVAFVLKAQDGSEYYFTKGDNNPVYDFQVHDERFGMGNSPIASSQSKGKVIARIPLLGNFKLFISPPVLLGSAVQAGCDSHYTGPALAGAS